MSAAGAGAAAAAEARRRREEEEAMTPYTPRDLTEDWEFKILRSTTGMFKKPERLREVLNEEARAGWVLVEKFDSQRLRLKRPVTARAGDAGVGFDPYRTQVGMSDGAMVAVIIVSIVSTLVLAGLIIAAIKHP